MTRALKPGPTAKQFFESYALWAVREVPLRRKDVPILCPFERSLNELAAAGHRLIATEHRDSLRGE